LQKSDLIVIAGRHGMGKTAFALSMAKNIAVDLHKPMVYFSLQYPALRFANRLISNLCMIEGKKIRDGQMDRDERGRFDKVITSLRTMGAPLYIDDTPSLSVSELRTKARKLVRKNHIELIMIDYLQLMTTDGMRFECRKEEVSAIICSLKGLAKELNLPIIVLCQLYRTIRNEVKRPLLSDLREIGAIEQYADMVLFVHRPEYYHLEYGPNGEDYRGMAEIIIAKHRKGATDIVLLKFRGEYTRFENPEDNMLENHALPFPPSDSYNPFNV
jgi:replicative DNA helicase